MTEATISLCPVCNGFAELQASCRSCGSRLLDAGRLADFFGAYSPYEPIDESKLSNGFLDLAERICLHVGWCQACNSEQLYGIGEWS